MRDRSYSYSTDVECPRCKKPYTVPVWLIVDALERPDLVRRARGGTLLRLRCPHCLVGVVKIGTAYALFRADAPLKVLLVFPEDSTPDTLDAQEKQLVELLRQQIGKQWDEVWLTEASAFMAESSIERSIDEEWDDLPSYDLTDPVIRAALEFGRTQDVESWREAVRETPDLLDEEVIQFMLHQIATAEERGSSSAANLPLAVDFLRRCRDVGPDVACNERRTLKPSQLDEESEALVEQFLKSQDEFDQSEAIVIGEKLIARLDPKRDAFILPLLYHMLGGRLRQYVGGDRAGNMERSVAAYETAVQMLNEELRPNEWAGAVVGLAQSLQERMEGNRGENYDRAIMLCESALQKLEGRSVDPNTRAMLYDALGAAYTDHPSRDRIDNIERAIDAFKSALTVGTDEIGLAMIMNNMGRACNARILGDRRFNLQMSIGLYERALKILAAPEFAIDYALGAMNLGISYLELGSEDDREQAIRWLEKALGYYQTGTYEWARVQSNLATAYAGREIGGRENNLARARQHFADALLATSTLGARREAALAARNFATFLTHETQDTTLYDPETATLLLEQALEIDTIDTNPVECRRIAVQLGELHRASGRMTDALQAYDRAAAAAESLYRVAYVPGNQLIEAKTNAEVFDGCVSLCLEGKSDPELRRRALVYSERGRSRQFLDQMGLAPIPVPPGAPPDIIARETVALENLRMIETAFAVPQTNSRQERDLADDRQKTLGELTAIWRELEAFGDAGREYVSLRRGESPTWADLVHLMETLGPNVACVSMYTWADGLAVFVMRADWSAPEAYLCPLSNAELQDFLRNFDEEVSGHQEFRASGRIPSNRWCNLGDLLFDSALPHLASAKVVYLFPHGDLHRLPLHALTVKGEPLIQRVPVAYAPSLAILGRTLTRHREPASHSSGSALVLAFADANDPESREEFGEEAGRIASRLGSTPIVDLAANGAAIRSRGPTAAIIHLACHGFFSTDDPLGSGIVLADGVFAARDWMAIRLQCDLVTLSVCESGRLQTSRGDEVTGVTRALLYAGASTAIVTLWRVWSDAALRWTLEFYSRAWGEDGMKRCDDATAFREATLALRAEDPDVVAWAPFVLVGDWQ